LEVGTFKALSEIHYFLFRNIYEFAGKIRDVNIAKGDFKFAPRIYLEQSLDYIDKLPQENFDEIISSISTNCTFFMSFANFLHSFEKDIFENK